MMMRVGFYQFRPLFGQNARNVGTICAALADVEVDLLVLPELAISGYYFRDAAEAHSLAETPRASANLDSLSELCARRDFHMVVGFLERAGERCFNSAALIGPEGVERIYRKLHLFNEEKCWMSPGDTPLDVINVRGAHVGMMICFDWVFPEVARSLTLKGAQILCHPSNIVLKGYCQQAMLTRCLENGVYAITANRFGYDKRPHGELRFTGASQIVAPGGRLIHRANAQRECLYIMEIDPALADSKGITAGNDLLDDRRAEYYF
ncbi:MAG: nitrilase-related carbon-nitrogen hydrolase [Candidatus Eutrophobiaceae bacterium]